MVVTGASAYLQYDWESTFQDGGSNRNKVFGLNQRIRNKRWINNQINLPQLNNVELPTKFGYGRNEGSASIEFNLSNPFWAHNIFGAPDATADSPAAGVNTFTYPSTSGVPKSPPTIGLETGISTDTAFKRVAKGVTQRSITIRSQLNQLVRCTAELGWGKESVETTNVSSSVVDRAQFPYTSVHASLDLPDGSPIAQLQSFEITMNNNAAQLYQLSQADSADAYRRLLNHTGRFNSSTLNKDNLKKVTDRSEVASLTIAFDNGQSGSDQEKITIKGTNIGPSESSINAIEPNEPIFEDLVWTIRNVTIEAITSAEGNNGAEP